MWPWRRKRDEPAPAPTPAPVVPTRPPADQWRLVAPIRRMVADDILANPVQRFSGSLASWQDPRFLGTLGHGVGAGEPSGTISEFARPATVLPDYPAGSLPEMPVATPEPAREARRNLGASFTVSRLAEPAGAAESSPEEAAPQPGPDVAPLTPAAPPITAGPEAAASATEAAPDPASAPAASSASPADTMPVAAPAPAPAEVPQLSGPAVPTLGAPAPPVPEPEGTSAEDDAAGPVQRVAGASLPPIQRAVDDAAMPVASPTTSPSPSSVPSPSPSPSASPSVQRAAEPSQAAPLVGTPIQRAVDADDEPGVQRVAADTPGAVAHDDHFHLPPVQRTESTLQPTHLPVSHTEAPVQRAAEPTAPSTSAPLELPVQRSAAPETPRRLGLGMPIDLTAQRSADVPTPFVQRLSGGDGGDAMPPAVQRLDDGIESSPGDGFGSSSGDGFESVRPVPTEAPAVPDAGPADVAPITGTVSDGPAMPFSSSAAPSVSATPSVQRLGLGPALQDGAPLLSPPPAPTLGASPISPALPGGPAIPSGPTVPGSPTSSGSSASSGAPTVSRIADVPGLPGLPASGLPVPALPASVSSDSASQSAFSDVPSGSSASPAVRRISEPGQSSVAQREPDLPVAVTHSDPMARPVSNGPLVPVEAPSAPIASVASAPLLPVVSRLVGDRPIRPALTDLPTPQPAPAGAAPAPADLPAVPVAQLTAEPPAGAPTRVAVPVQTLSASSGESSFGSGAGSGSGGSGSGGPAISGSGSGGGFSFGGTFASGDGGSGNGGSGNGGGFGSGGGFGNGDGGTGGGIGGGPGIGAFSSPSMPTLSTSAGSSSVQRSTATPAAASPVMRLLTANATPAADTTQRYDPPPITVSRVVTVSASAANPTPTVQRAEEGAAAPAAAAPAADAAQPAAPGAPGAAADKPDELVKKLFDPLLRRLKAELRLDRERRGSLTDLRH